MTEPQLEITVQDINHLGIVAGIVDKIGNARGSQSTSGDDGPAQYLRHLGNDSGWREKFGQTFAMKFAEAVLDRVTSDISMRLSSKSTARVLSMAGSRPGCHSGW